jgi:hypothetical protein
MFGCWAQSDKCTAYFGDASLNLRKLSEKYSSNVERCKPIAAKTKRNPSPKSYCCLCVAMRAPYHLPTIRCGIPLGDVGCCCSLTVADRNPYPSMTACLTRALAAPSSARWYASSPSMSPPWNVRRTRRFTSRDVSSCWSASSGPSARVVSRRSDWTPA